jgi:putative transposase
MVVPGLPHHVTQRGNRREPIFLQAGDQEFYLRTLADQTRRHEVECWAYCLMPNHVHLILTPQRDDGLARAVGETHRRYTSYINDRHRLSGHLFQGRFASFAMDDGYFLRALAYVSLNPVRAELVDQPEDWRWSSVRAHLDGRDDSVVRVRPVLERGWDFAALLTEALRKERSAEADYECFRSAASSGRPLLGGGPSATVNR